MRSMSERRPYRSDLRQERARETELRIRHSAMDLFVRRGFMETTVNQIADQAGVAVQTVYSIFGSKGGIVAAMLEHLEESADQDGWVEKIFSEPDPRRQLRLFVSWLETLFAQGSHILRAALAARSEPGVADFLDRGNANRRDGISQLVGLWSNRSALRHDLNPEEATEQFWLLTSAELALLAVDRLEWTTDRYGAWLVELLERELFEPNP